MFRERKVIKMQSAMGSFPLSYQPEYQIDRTSRDTASSTFALWKELELFFQAHYPIGNPVESWRIDADSRSMKNTLSRFAVDTSSIATSSFQPADAELEEFLNGGAVTLVPKRSIDITIEFVGEPERGLPTPIADSDCF